MQWDMGSIRHPGRDHSQRLPIMKEMKAGHLPRPLQSTPGRKTRKWPHKPHPWSDDPEMIPQTPPMEQSNKKAHSPITFNTTQEDAPRRPVKDRLGLMQDYVQDETPKRPVKDRLGTRRSKRNIRPFNPFKRGCAPPRSAEFNRETWDRDQAGYWYPI